MNPHDSTIDFILGDRLASAPTEARRDAKRSLLDLIGVWAAGRTTECSRIACDAAATFWPAAQGGATIVFEGRRATAAGAAFAGGQTIDAVDAHDGFKPAKGHAGVAVLPGILAVAEAENVSLTDASFLELFILGYEISCRVAIAQHRTCPDYHASGSWNALGVAAASARLLGLDRGATRQALGIAEYYGPRSQIMRVVDYPAMIKDASGWGAMTGVTAAYLAKLGMTGAPVLMIESPEVADVWADLGQRWRMTEQYMKPWPVCRWAQPAVQAALQLVKEHRLAHGDVASIAIHTFHEACRLGNQLPATTDEAQYAIAFPTACAFVRGKVGVDEIAGSGLQDPQILDLARRIELVEAPEFNAVFPANRRARLTVTLRNGAIIEGPVTEPPGDPEAPLSDQAVIDKFYDLATPTLGRTAADDLVRAIGDFHAPNFDLPAMWQCLRALRIG